MGEWISGLQIVEMLWPLGQMLAEHDDSSASEPTDPEAADRLVGRIMEAGSLDCIADAPIEEVRALRERLTKAMAAWALMGDAGVMTVPPEASQAEIASFAIFQLHSASRAMKRSPH